MSDRIEECKGVRVGLSFTAIDFETANEQRASVCSVGVAVVRDGALVEATSWLVQPPTGTRFTNTRIHGITASRAATGSLWADSVEAINQYAGDGPLVAYNSLFDKGVYAAASRACEVDLLDHVWRDARVAAKTHLVLDSYRLTDVTQHLGLGHFDHHDAKADAVACANVILELARRLDLLSLEDVWPTHFAVTPSSYRRIPLPATSASANPAHPLHGVSVTFTGDLLGYTRNEARAAAAALGATVTAGPTRKTDVVVVGGFEPSTLRPGAITSNKLQKAMDLRNAGHRLELISEADFVALMAFEPEAG